MAIPMAVGKAVGSAVGQVGIQLVLEKAFFNKDVKNTVKSTESAFSKSFNGIEKNSGKTFGNIGGFIKTAFSIVGISAITQFTKSAISSASETQSAWTGLNSIVQGTGKSFAEAKEFLDEYVSDGLIPLTDAITSYKNLASRGYSTEQIEKTMLALKDASAFGRQASYSYGEAIKSATEGLKNENSVLVDNAGVTKNVAKMWDDYAKSIGTTANNLTQQQKIQAEVNGIIEETKFQTGDASAYAETFSGKIAKINTAFYNFKVAVGKFVAPIAELFLPYIEKALNALTRFFNKMGQVLKVFGLEMPDVVSKAGSSVAGVGDSAVETGNNIASTGDIASKTAKKIKRAFAGIDEINVLSMPKDTSGSNGGSGGSEGSGGSSGIGGAFTDTTEFTEVADSVDSSASKIAKKIKELFEPLTKIDLTNITNAFDRLKESVAPLTEKLFSGLRWLWDEVLVPFTTWAIEDAIPAFFNLLAGSLDLLNGVIDYAKPYLQWMWEEFLQPIASWTGGVIVKVLNWIGDGLSKVGKWLSDNKSTFAEVSEELEPFSKMYKELGELLGKMFGLAWDNFTRNMKILWDSALKPLWEYFLKPLLSTYWSSLKTLASILGDIFEACNKIMEGDWEGAGKTIVEGLTEGVKDLWANGWVKQYIYDPIVGWWKKIDTTLGISTKFETTKDTVSNWWSNVKTWWSGKKDSVTKYIQVGVNNTLTKDKVTKWWSNIKTWWSGKKDSITKYLNVGTKNTTDKKQVSGWWSTIKSWWGSKKLSIGSTISATKTQVSNWWNTIKNWWGSKTLTISAKISDVTANLKSWINKNFIDKVNSKLPSWLGKIPRLAQGGWMKANNPQLAIVGDNKTEPEIVSPESKIREQVVKGIEEVGMNNTNQKIDFTIRLEYPDGKYLIREINNQQIKDGKISLLV